MILFTRETAEMIVLGRKTQTRRCWKKGRTVKPGSIHWAQTDYSASSRFARLVIIDTREEDPMTISEEDARREGFDSQSDFIKAYYALNPRADQDVASGEKKHYVINFRVHELAWQEPPEQVKNEHIMQIEDREGRMWRLEYSKGQVPRR